MPITPTWELIYNVPNTSNNSYLNYFIFFLTLTHSSLSVFCSSLGEFGSNFTSELLDVISLSLGFVSRHEDWRRSSGITWQGKLFFYLPRQNIKSRFNLHCYNLSLVTSFYTDTSVLLENSLFLKFFGNCISGTRVAHFSCRHRWGNWRRYFLLFYHCLYKQSVKMPKNRFVSIRSFKTLFSRVKTMFCSNASLFRKILLLYHAFADKIHIFTLPCNILYLDYRRCYKKVASGSICSQKETMDV